MAIKRATRNTGRVVLRFPKRPSQRGLRLEAAGRPEASPRYLGFNSYAYVLEAAIAGRGIALGWRGFIERHLDTGSLVVLVDGLSHRFGGQCR